MKGKELRAFLAESRRRFAPGKGLRRWRGGDLCYTAKDRTRTGTGEHGEYYTADQKVILRGPLVRMAEKIHRPEAEHHGGPGIDLLCQR